ncbi:hypothetical protein EDF35_1954 [Rathayibacter sp. PhB151]|uniref:hypothetical protein n=1 Tax=Rathayibacter sp. PhB151 TaxID=2485189 RepID=UPI0010636479|nr:hypothetical protein [Rathayibacter sp. PhB151]TDX78738.1 hypothetical protein EDF35_1954 [Rathayibacter sp. PhB151]
MPAELTPTEQIAALEAERMRAAKTYIASVVDEAGFYVHGTLDDVATALANEWGWEAFDDERIGFAEIMPAVAAAHVAIVER